jgi:uncharacterized membrane protein YozB (DUF420 family)
MEIQPIATMAEQDRHRPRFFLFGSYLLLLIVFIGFSPTFYLRFLFDGPELSPMLITHGLCLTAWFVCFCVMTTAVSMGKLAVHRRLGKVACGVALLVVITGVAVSTEFAARRLAGAESIDEAVSRASMVVWANLAILVSFVVCFVAAIAQRRKGDVHKRLMWLASASLCIPALARIPRNIPLGVPEAPFALGTILVMILSLAAFDRGSFGRVHRVTSVGGGLVLMTLAILPLVVSKTAFGHAVVRVLF